MAERFISIKNVNEQRILNLLRRHPDMSRAEMGRKTRLGKASVSEIVAKLLADGLVQETGNILPYGTMGRPSVMLRLNATARLAVGVEWTGSECIAVLADLYAVPLRERRLPTPCPSVDAIVDVIESLVHELLRDYDSEMLLGVGVGVPGLVGLDRRRVIQAVNVGWSNVPLADLLQARLNSEVTVVRRQNAGALGEYWYGTDRGQSNLVFVSVGLGIGSGTVVHGRIFEGTCGSAGELGHVTVLPDGPRCRCGNRGCLEAIASTEAIVHKVRQRIGDGASSSLTRSGMGALDHLVVQDILDAAEAGDPLALSVVTESGTYIGIALADLANLWNPSMIFIGGEVWGRDAVLNAICQTVKQRALPTACGDLKIAFSSLGYRAAAIGAANLIADRFFSIPEGMGLTLVES